MKSVGFVLKNASITHYGNVMQTYDDAVDWLTSYYNKEEKKLVAPEWFSDVVAVLIINTSRHTMVDVREVSELINDAVFEAKEKAK